MSEVKNPYKQDGHYNHPGSLMHKLAEDWERKRSTTSKPNTAQATHPLFAQSSPTFQPNPQGIPGKQPTQPVSTRQTPRLSLAQVKKAAAYPSALAARHGSLRRPSVTSAPEISQLEESPIEDAQGPPVLIRQPEVLPRG
jgi:hypothetical protein